MHFVGIFFTTINKNSSQLKIFKSQSKHVKCFFFHFLCIEIYQTQLLQAGD